MSAPLPSAYNCVSNIMFPNDMFGYVRAIRLWFNCIASGASDITPAVIGLRAIINMVPDITLKWCKFTNDISLTCFCVSEKRMRSVTTEYFSDSEKLALMDMVHHHSSLFSNTAIVRSTGTVTMSNFIYNSNMSIGCQQRGMVVRNLVRVSLTEHGVFLNRIESIQLSADKWRLASQHTGLGEAALYVERGIGDAFGHVDGRNYRHISLLPF